MNSEPVFYAKIDELTYDRRRYSLAITYGDGNGKESNYYFRNTDSYADALESLKIWIEERVKND